VPGVKTLPAAYPQDNDERVEARMLETFGSAAQ
jgi:hypothetical protein